MILTIVDYDVTEKRTGGERSEDIERKDFCSQDSNLNNYKRSPNHKD